MKLPLAATSFTASRGFNEICPALVARQRLRGKAAQRDRTLMELCQPEAYAGLTEGQTGNKGLQQIRYFPTTLPDRFRHGRRHPSRVHAPGRSYPATSLQHAAIAMISS